MIAQYKITINDDKFTTLERVYTNDENRKSDIIYNDVAKQLGDLIRSVEGVK